MAEVLEVFQQLGLTKNESKVLNILYKKGRCSLTEISKFAGIHRANTYDAIDGLSSQGLVTTIQNEGKKLYQAVPPANLINIVKVQEMMVQEIIPKLELDYSYGTKKNLVEIKEGAKAIRDLFLHYLDLNKTIYTYNVPKGAVGRFGVAFQNRFHEMRIKQKQKMYHIYNSDATERVKILQKMEYTPVRMLPTKFDGPMCTRICGDLITFTFYDMPKPLTVTFRNEAVAKSYEKYFFVIWNKAKPFDKL